MSTYVHYPIMFLSYINEYPNIFGTHKSCYLKRVIERIIYKSASRIYKKQQKMLLCPRLGSSDSHWKGQAEGVRVLKP